MKDFINIGNLVDKTFPTFNENHLRILSILNTFKTREKSKRILFILLALGQILKADTHDNYYFLYKIDGDIYFELDNTQLKEFFTSEKLPGYHNISSIELNRSLKEIRDIFTKEIILSNDKDKLRMFDTFVISTEGVKGKFNSDFLYLLNCHSNNKEKEWYDDRVGEYIIKGINIYTILDFTINELILFSLVRIRHSYNVKQYTVSARKKLNKYIFCNYSTETTDMKKKKKLEEILNSLNKKLLESDGYTIDLEITTRKVGRKTLIKEILPYVIEEKR